jgi:hypothetical protein
VDTDYCDESCPLPAELRLERFEARALFSRERLNERRIDPEALCKMSLVLETRQSGCEPLLAKL